MAAIMPYHQIRCIVDIAATLVSGCAGSREGCLALTHASGSVSVLDRIAQHDACQRRCVFVQQQASASRRRDAIVESEVVCRDATRL